jgi:hypothetical protein
MNLGALEKKFKFFSRFEKFWPTAQWARFSKNLKFCAKIHHELNQNFSEFLHKMPSLDHHISVNKSKKSNI